MCDVVLVGAGGHARGVCEILEITGHRVVAYVDPRKSNWLDRPQISEDAVGDGAFVALGIGGVKPRQLASRLHAIAERWQLVSVIHPSATVSCSAVIEAGAHVMPGAVIEPNVRVGRMAIVNSRATLIHDCEVGASAHIAPGAVVLAGAKIGQGAMIGAGAVILPFTTVPAEGMVGALQMWRNAAQ